MLQVFCGKIPNSIFEDSLIPMFEKCGTIWDLRLMMDPSTGLNKTFCFVMFTTKEGAQTAVKQVCRRSIVMLFAARPKTMVTCKIKHLQNICFSVLFYT